MPNPYIVDNQEIVFSSPVSAPSITVEDIYIATPDIPADEAAALSEAVKEFDKGKGAKKSMGIMLLASIKVIKKLSKEMLDIQDEIDKLKKKKGTA